MKSLRQLMWGSSAACDMADRREVCDLIRANQVGSVRWELRIAIKRYTLFPPSP
jgi:hypothetical protein